MPAPMNNTFATKWTLEKTRETLTIIEAHSRMWQTEFLSEALDKAGIHRNIWHYWYKIWADNEEIMDRMQLVDQRFETKILKESLNRRYHAGTAMLLLKTKYGYGEEKVKKEE